MTFVRTERIPNGDYFTKVQFYSCDRCNKEIFEGHPHMKIEEKQHYCWDCSYILEFINEKDYLKFTGVGVNNVHASVRDGNVIIWIGKRAPWEQTNKDIRNSSQYGKWRTKVFERDKYTCQHCDQVGGELNAHHIKPFAKYKKLRFVVSNGLTLCVDCHREVHKKER